MVCLWVKVVRGGGGFDKDFLVRICGEDASWEIDVGKLR